MAGMLGALQLEQIGPCLVLSIQDFTPTISDRRTYLDINMVIMTPDSSKRGAEKGGAITSPSVRVGPLMGLPALVASLGCDPGKIFSEAGFDLSDFTDSDNKIPFVQGSRLFAHCAAKTGCDDLGLRLGQQVDPSSLGVAGFMARSAEDVGTALYDLVRHLGLHDQGAVLNLTTTDHTAFFSYLVHLSGVEATDQIYDLSIAVACKVMRAFCGNAWNPRKVLFSRQPPRDPTPYRRFFKAPVQFNANQNALVFSKRWLKHRLTTADAFLHHYLAKEAARIHEHEKTDFLADLRRHLREALAQQNCRSAVVAKKLGMHERTLNRRLQEQGTNYRSQLESLRHGLAKSVACGYFYSAVKDLGDAGLCRYDSVQPCVQTMDRTDTKRMARSPSDREFSRRMRLQEKPPFICFSNRSS